MLETGHNSLSSANVAGNAGSTAVTVLPIVSFLYLFQQEIVKKVRIGTVRTSSASMIRTLYSRKGPGQNG